MQIAYSTISYIYLLEFYVYFYYVTVLFYIPFRSVNLSYFDLNC